MSCVNRNDITLEKQVSYLLIKGTVMQNEKVLINDRLCVSKLS